MFATHLKQYCLMVCLFLACRYFKVCFCKFAKRSNEIHHFCLSSLSHIIFSHDFSPTQVDVSLIKISYCLTFSSCFPQLLLRGKYFNGHQGCSGFIGINGILLGTEITSEPYSLTKGN